MFKFFKAFREFYSICKQKEKLEAEMKEQQLKMSQSTIQLDVTACRPPDERQLSEVEFAELSYEKGTSQDWPFITATGFDPQGIFKKMNFYPYDKVPFALALYFAKKNEVKNEVEA